MQSRPETKQRGSKRYPAGRWPNRRQLAVRAGMLGVGHRGHPPVSGGRDNAGVAPGPSPRVQAPSPLAASAAPAGFGWTGSRVGSVVGIIPSILDRKDIVAGETRRSRAASCRDFSFRRSPRAEDGPEREVHAVAAGYAAEFTSARETSRACRTRRAAAKSARPSLRRGWGGLSVAELCISSSAS